MKNKLTILFALAVLIFAPPATAQLNRIGTALDTAKPNTTKLQTLKWESATTATVQYNLHSLTDSLTGYVSLWASIDGATYAPYPGADSVAIVAHTDVNKLWFLFPKPQVNQIRFLQIRTRCPSNTTNTTGKGYITSNLYQVPLPK